MELKKNILNRQHRFRKTNVSFASEILNSKFSDVSAYPIATAEARKVKRHDSQVVGEEVPERDVAGHSEQEKRKGKL